MSVASALNRRLTCFKHLHKRERQRMVAAAQVANCV